MKKLTQREAWRKIANAFAKYANTGIRGKYSWGGMCRAIAVAHASRLLGRRTNVAMLEKLHRNMPSNINTSYWWPLDPDGAKKRAAFIRKTFLKRGKR